MNRSGAFIGVGVVLIILAFLGFSVVALAAVTDNTGPARLASFSGYCPDDDTSPCIIEVRRVRPMTADAAREAVAASLEVQPLRELPARRSVTRDVVTKFLAGSTTAAP